MSTHSNIVVLFTDQQRFDTIAAAGYGWMKTPNLDRLVREGCLFRNAYTPNPVCVPARHCLLTGQPSRRHGFYTNGGPGFADEGVPTLPRILSENGYHTAAVGKMHFKPVRAHNGFDEMHLMEEIPRHRYDDAYATYLAEQGYEEIRCLHGVRPLIYHEPQKALVPEEHHGEAWVARKTVEVIKANKDRPFFVMAGFIKPHPPWNVPEGWEALYDDVDLPEPIPPCRAEPYDTVESDWYGDNDSAETKRAIRKAYYASISFVDHQIGVILDSLEREGMLDETFILFTSDHGEMLQDRGEYQKSKPYESATRIPLMIRSPRHVEPGSVDERFVDLMDVLPTVLDAAGIDYDEKPWRRNYPLPGGSLIGTDNPGRDRDVQFCEFGSNPRWAMIRDRRYKYIYFYGGPFECLYDLQEDPGETRDLLKLGEAPPDVYESLRKRLIEFEQERAPEDLVAKKGLAVLHHSPPKSGSSGSKFAAFGNRQAPAFGRLAPEREADILVTETLAALGNPDPEQVRALAPDPTWIETWINLFEGRGGTRESWQRLFGADCLTRPHERGTHQGETR